MCAMKQGLIGGIIGLVFGAVAVLSAGALFDSGEGTTTPEACKYFTQFVEGMPKRLREAAQDQGSIHDSQLQWVQRAVKLQHDTC